MVHFVYSNDFIQLFIDAERVYLTVTKAGFEITEFQNLLKNYPRIRITQFAALKQSLLSAVNQQIYIGDHRPVFEISISSDQLKAYAVIHLTPEEFETFNKKQLIADMLVECKKLGIAYGVDISEFTKNMVPLEKFVIANGLLPVNGEDAIIKLYELEDLKPQIFADGKVNYYEMNLINKVHQGDWVGERIEPTLGAPGKTVTGHPIPAQPGRQHKLVYDRKTIAETKNSDGTKTLLSAIRDGAVVYENGILSVCNYLEINGEVSYETGNIDFDGFVEVKKTIEDNFSVRADYDIQIMGALGVGGVDTVESREGNIYIRGGIAGKNKAKIKCNGDLFIKFVADCTIECEGTVNIGYYAMNTNIRAKEVILENYNSKIIGGNIEVDVRVVAGEIGSRAEAPTNIRVIGFNRHDYKEEYDRINQTITEIKDNIVYVGQKLAVLASNNLDEKQKLILRELEDALEKYNKKLKALYEKRKRYTSYLQSKGDGEVKVNHCIYPQVTISIKNHTETNKKLINLPIAYYVMDNELKKL